MELRPFWRRERSLCQLFVSNHSALRKRYGELTARTQNRVDEEFPVVFIDDLLADRDPEARAMVSLRAEKDVMKNGNMMKLIVFGEFRFPRSRLIR